MSPEFGKGTVYDQAINASPIAHAFLLKPRCCEAFLNAIGARSMDLEARHPDFNLRQVKSLVITGQSLGALPYGEEDDDAEDWESTMKIVCADVEALFLIGYELGTEENIDELFDCIFAKVREYGYVDFDEEDYKDEENKQGTTNAEAFVHLALIIGAHYRDLDNGRIVNPSLEPPVITTPPPKVPDEYAGVRKLLNW